MLPQALLIHDKDIPLSVSKFDVNNNCGKIQCVTLLPDVNLHKVCVTILSIRQVNYLNHCKELGKLSDYSVVSYKKIIETLDHIVNASSKICLAVSYDPSQIFHQMPYSNPAKRWLWYDVIVQRVNNNWMRMIHKMRKLRMFQNLRFLTLVNYICMSGIQFSNFRSVFNYDQRSVLQVVKLTNDYTVAQLQL